MSELSDCIAEVLRVHRRVLSDMTPDGCTGCDWRGADHTTYAAHVAEAVEAKLTSDGYRVMRPITAEEEAKNVW
jgi:hypothetical protein